MTHTLHLVDATYELFRAHFSMPSMTAPDGREVGAVYGLLGSIISLLRDASVTHIGCATDSTVTSWRNERFADYKDGSGIEPELLAQFPLAEDALRALGLTVWPMQRFEADDAIGSATHHLQEHFDAVVICSPDKDFAQLVNDRVTLLDRRRDIRYDPDGVREKWGVNPASIPDYLALVGDTADGIPGIKGWGAKSTATVLTRYHHIEDIPTSADDWDIKVRGAKGLASRLADALDDVLLYKELATLRFDAPIDATPESVRWPGLEPTAWRTFCEANGFNRIIDRALTALPLRPNPTDPS